MGLNSDKTSKVFCFNIWCFSIRFCFFVPQWNNHPSFIKIVDVSDLYTPQNQNVHCAVSSNDQYQWNGFAADVLLGPMSRPNRSHRKRSFQYWEHDGMRPPKLRPSRSISRRVIAFRIFSNNDRPPFWIIKMLIFDHVTVIVVRICCCIPNFSKIGSRVWPPDAHNCWMSSAQLLGNSRCHGNHIMEDMSGTWWDATSQVSPNWSIARWVVVFLIFSNMAAVRHFEF